MARINTSLQGGASLPTDASPARKRRRGGDDSTNNDAGVDRASKRSRHEDKAKGDKKNKKVKGTSSDEPRRSGRDRNSGDGNTWWQTTAPNAEAVTESPAAKEARPGPKPAKAGKPKPSNAGRPAKAGASTEAAEAEEAAEATPPNKRSKAAKEKPNKAKEKPDKTKEKPAKAARAEKAAAEAAAEDAEPADAIRVKPRRGRPRASNASTEPAAEPPATKSPATKSPASKKAKKTKEPKKTKNKSGATKLPRASKKGASARVEQSSPAAISPAQPRQTVEEGEEQEQEQEEDDDVESEDEDGDGNAQQPFRQLVPRTRLVPLATMTNKWAPLDRDAIAAVQALLDDCARPVLARLGSSAEKKERQEIARQVVTGVTRRLRSKLVKGIPFPTDGAGGRTGGKKTATKQKSNAPSQVPFLSEPTAETHALQSQLTPLQHAVALLEGERRREEAALADEYAQLRALETNAQAELRTWRERQRRQHVLADSSGRGTGHGESRDAPKGTVGLQNEDGTEKDEKPGLFSDSFDSSVVDLASLGNHMESVRSNLHQIDGVVAAMARSRAALQDVLGERLSGEQYERVLLGR